MENKETISEVVDGIARGSRYVHGLISSLRWDFGKWETTWGRKFEAEKPTRLEESVAALTALAEVAAYTYLAKKGINLYYFPLATNAVDLVGLGTYWKLAIKSYMNMTSRNNIGPSWLG